MQTDITKIQSYLKNKDICLIGNASSILKKPKNIDKHEIVCRINKGLPTGKETYIGSRTNVLFLATRISSHKITRIYKPKFILWLTPWQKLASKTVISKGIIAPKKNWHELFKLLKRKKPSSGLMSLYFLLKYINFKKLTIYGFDFFESGTWYWEGEQKWHNGEAEKILIKQLIEKRKNIRIIYE